MLGLSAGIFQVQFSFLHHIVAFQSRITSIRYSSFSVHLSPIQYMLYQQKKKLITIFLFYVLLSYGFFVYSFLQLYFGLISFNVFDSSSLG